MEAKLKDQFVPYELALKLKGLGFDEKCFGWFNYNQEIQYAPSVVKIDLHNDYTLAPLWQQAFDWFSINGIESWITYDYPFHNQDGTYKVSWYNHNTNKHGIIMKDNFKDRYSGVKSFTTKKEAKIACLEQLIELVEKIKAAIKNT